MRGVRWSLRLVFVALLTLAATSACSSGIVGTGSTSGSQTGAGTRPPSGTASASAALSPSCVGACLADPKAFDALVRAAKVDTPILLGYDYRHLAADHAAADALISPSFAQQYDQTWNVVGQLAPQKHAVTRFSVSEVGVISLSADGGRASLLVLGQSAFSDSSTTSPRLDMSSPILTLQRQGGAWRVANLVTTGPPPTDLTALGSAALRVAVNAARQEALNLTTYARATFDIDYQRAVDAATGSLATDLRDAGHRTQLSTQMTSGHFDLKGTVNCVAVSAVSPTEVTVLALVDSRQLVDGTSPSGPTSNRFKLTVVAAGSGWKVSDLQAIGLR